MFSFLVDALYVPDAVFRDIIRQIDDYSDPSCSGLLTQCIKNACPQHNSLNK